MSVLKAESLKKAYPGVKQNHVLCGVSFEVSKGESVALLGASGSGKSTLLNCCGLLDTFDSGSLHVLGHSIADLNSSQKARFRLEKIGFIFQFHHLIPELNALENIELPASLRGDKHKHKRALELLERVGLKNKGKSFPWQLSGGEQQRVAVARALVNGPELIFTDEATGNLDRPRAMEILDLLFECSQETGATLLSVTHDEEQAKRYSRRLRLKEGQIWDLLPHSD
jgi:ABC-type lipoprotein export system ATPase subunit